MATETVGPPREPWEDLPARGLMFLFGLVSFGVFAVVRIPPLLEWYEGTPPRAHTMTWELASAGRWVGLGLVWALIGYVALALPGVLLARSGVRAWFWVPATLFFFLPDRLGLPSEPALVTGSIDSAWMADQWARAAVELVLIVAPAAVVAMRVGPRTPRTPLGARVAAGLVAVAGVGLLRHAMSLLGPVEPYWPAAALVTSFAVLWDVRNPARVLGLVAVTTMASSVVFPVLALFVPGSTGTATEVARIASGEPLYLVAAAAALSAPLARLFARFPVHRAVSATAE